MNLQEIQFALKESGVDGWLFADHHSRDPVAAELLGLPRSEINSRRWYYLIPQAGEPRKLLHRIEPNALSTLPGSVVQYSSWQEQEAGVKQILDGCGNVAMQYSKNGSLLRVSLVDAGVVELVRSFGVDVISSAALIQRAFAIFSPAQEEMHLEAGRRVDGIRREAFELVGRETGRIRETDVRDFILRRFSESGLFTDHGPVVAVKNHSGDPHYEPEAGKDYLIETGDLVLIDLWAKLLEEEAPYYDITWVGFLGEPPPLVHQVFETVASARDLAIQLIKDRVKAKVPIAGYEVDREVRAFIDKAGFGAQFVHRTGHSIGTSVHGAGANIDDFESRDERLLIPGSCFSIEPGIYLKEFGVRLEVDMIIGCSEAIVTGEIQRNLLRL